jgi:hypothetical protein
MISIVLTGLIWLLAVLAISKVVERVWAHTIRGKGFRYFVAPGVITHEFSHAGACLATRTKIHEIALFEPNGGYVTHDRPKRGWVSSIIGMAPVLGCFISLGVTLWILDNPLKVGGVDADSPVTIRQFANAVAADKGIWAQTTAMFSDVWNTSWRTLTHRLPNADWSSWKTYLFLYLGISFVICLCPSAKDFDNSARGVWQVAVGIVAITAVLHFAMPADGVVEWIAPTMTKLLAFTATMLVITLAASAGPVILIRFLRR